MRENAKSHLNDFAAELNPRHGSVPASEKALKETCGARNPAGGTIRFSGIPGPENSKDCSLLFKGGLAGQGLTREYAAEGNRTAMKELILSVVMGVTFISTAIAIVYYETRPR